MGWSQGFGCVLESSPYLQPTLMSLMCGMIADWFEQSASLCNWMFEPLCSRRSLYRNQEQVLCSVPLTCCSVVRLCTFELLRKESNIKCY